MILAVIVVRTLSKSSGASTPVFGDRSMLNIEREPLTFTFGRADHDDGRPSGEGIAQFIPDVWVVGRNVCQADAGIANPLRLECGHACLDRHDMVRAQRPLWRV